MPAPASTARGGESPLSIRPGSPSCGLPARTRRTKAEALAAGLGVRVGALVEAVEAGAERPEPKGGRRFAALAADVPIEAGEAVVVCSVSVTFQAEQG